MAAVPLSSARIIGAFGSLSGVALFARTRVILRASDGDILTGARWTADTVEGELLSEGAWQGLQDSDEAFAWPCTGKLAGPVQAWIVSEASRLDRPALLNELWRACALADNQATSQCWAFLVQEDRVPGLLERLCAGEAALARQALTRSCFPDAANHARCAWLLAPDPTPPIVALLVHCLTLGGELQRAQGYRRVERIAHGPVFDALVEAELKALIAETQASESSKKGTST